MGCSFFKQKAKISRKQQDLPARTKKTDECTPDDSETRDNSSGNMREDAEVHQTVTDLKPEVVHLSRSNGTKTSNDEDQKVCFTELSQRTEGSSGAATSLTEDSEACQEKEDEQSEEELHTRMDTAGDVEPSTQRAQLPEEAEEGEDGCQELLEETKNSTKGPTEEKLSNGLEDSLGHIKCQVNGFHDLGEEEEEEEEEDERRWSFPPQLEEFNLMDSETDPAELETIFTDERLSDIRLTLEPEGPGLGISIAGGTGSPSGKDLPIVVKRVLPHSAAERDGRLKPGDELIAVNDVLLVGVDKTYAVEALSHLEGRVRFLVLQDY